MKKNNIPEEKEIILAFFDILGSSKRLMDNEYQKVYEFYNYMVKLCSDTEVPLSYPGIFPEEQGKEMLILYPMHHAFLVIHLSFGWNIMSFYNRGWADSMKNV